MKVIAQKVWNEPAVFIGLVTTLALLVLAFATTADWTAQTIAGIIAPVASSLGIRQLVTPTSKEAEDVGRGPAKAG